MHVRNVHCTHAHSYTPTHTRTHTRASRSVRGYSYGELGAARRFLEAAVEARLPLRNYGLPGTAYVFTEMGTDLGSARGLEGNPTEYYRKPGRGMSYGAGLKLLGACRFEYARDCNAGTGAVFVNWGERF